MGVPPKIGRLTIYGGELTVMPFFGTLGKQCRPRSDAIERSVWSGSALFANRNFYKKSNKNETEHQTPLKLEIDSSIW